MVSNDFLLQHRLRMLLRKVGYASLALSVSYLIYWTEVFTPGYQPLMSHHASAKSFYDYSLLNADGELESLSRYKDKVVLVVNVASQ